MSAQTIKLEPLPKKVEPKAATPAVTPKVEKASPPEPKPTTENTAVTAIINEPHDLFASLTATGIVPLEKNQESQVEIKDGVAEVSLASLPPGLVEVSLHDSAIGSPLQAPEPLKINVKAAEPREVRWSLPTEQVAGQELSIRITAVDERDMVCTHFQDHFVLQVESPDSHQIDVRMEKGQALVKMNHTKAESWVLKLEYKGQKTLKTPQAHRIEWMAGPAIRLILDGPQEYLAGNPLKVHVKAVDAYGNLAKTFHGTVILDVKAS